MNLHHTHNDLPLHVREKVVAVLQARLFDLLDLQSHARQAHWNVKGPAFAPLHELFDKINGQADGHIDDVAERIVELGGTALGTTRSAAKGSSLAEYPAELRAGPDHCRAMVASLGTLAKSVRADIDSTAAAGDADTADLLTGISRDLDKSLWFVEAHLQAER